MMTGPRRSWHVGVLFPGWRLKEQSVPDGGFSLRAGETLSLVLRETFGVANAVSPRRCSLIPSPLTESTTRHAKVSRFF
jgi:hypothetical protein